MTSSNNLDWMPIMNATEKYLEALKAKTGAASDYKLAQLLEISRQQMSHYRNKGEQFGEETCVKAASILEIDPIIVMAEVGMDRAKNEGTKAAWKMVFERLSGVAAMCLIATGINMATPSTGAASEAVTDYTLCEIKRRKRKTTKPFKIDLSFLVQNSLGLA